MEAPILECVPNFSEGRNPQKIAAIADAIRSVEGAHLLHIDTSPAAHRTVMTIAGAPQAVEDAAFAAISKAAQVIDMSAQEGVHPRIGATDVCPLIPLQGMGMDEADFHAKSLGKRVGEQLGIPVYLYEHSASSSRRRALPDIRKGQYEGFAEKMRMPDWAPDFGPLVFTPKSGATVIGARNILVAFNISLDTKDVAIAEHIASQLRTRGYKNETGQRIPGLLQKTRAIGWYMADYGTAQVSLNLLDYRTTSPLEAFEACRQLAEEAGVSVTGSELIGLMPEVSLLEAGTYLLMKKGMNANVEKSLLVYEGIEYLGLNRFKPFNPHEQILGYALQSAGLNIS